MSNRIKLANQEDLDDERKGEEEIKHLRDYMRTLNPEEREIYEVFIRRFYPRLVDDIKNELGQHRQTDNSERRGEPESQV